MQTKILRKKVLGRNGILYPMLVIAAVSVVIFSAFGGAVTRTATLPGVLTLRQGMNWAAIAKSQGVRLWVVVNGMQGANHDLIALHLHYVGVESALQMPAGNGL